MEFKFDLLLDSIVENDNFIGYFIIIESFKDVQDIIDDLNEALNNL